MSDRLNDDDVIARVKAAVAAQVSGVSADAPSLEARYDTPVTEISSRRALRWAVPVGLAAAAAVVLGAVLVTRGDNTHVLDVAATTTLPSPDDGSSVEHWILAQAGGRELRSAEVGTSSAVAVGTSVYYQGRNETFGAAVRTDGTSPLLARSSWTSVDTVSVHGVQATRYTDDDQELLVVPTTPALTIETYGPGPDDPRQLGVSRWDSVALAGVVRLVDGVWAIDTSAQPAAVGPDAATFAQEIGRRLPGTALTSTTLTYNGEILSVSDVPGGLVEYFLDAGITRGAMSTSGSGEQVVRIPGDGRSFALDRSRGPVVVVTGNRQPPEIVLELVDEASWRAHVYPVNPELGAPLPVPTLERWALHLEGATVTGAEDATTSAIGTGTAVYYAGTAGQSAAVRSGGAMPPADDQGWSGSARTTVLDTGVTLRIDGSHQLLKMEAEPAFSIETYGNWSARAIAATLHLVDDVWVADPTQIPATEIGRRTPDGPGMRYGFIQYDVDGRIVALSVMDHPAGTLGYLLDAGIMPTAPRTVNGMTFVQIDPGSWVVLRDQGPAVSILDSTPTGPPDAVLASLAQVSDAEWRALVADVRPDLARPGGPTVPSTTIGADPRPFGLYRAIGTLIEEPGKGVELCLGAIFDSLPPQCDGIPVSGLQMRWPDRQFQESADGTRWGTSYYLEGVYDGTTFRPTDTPRVASADERALFARPAMDFHTPCAEPAGGWSAAAATAPTDPTALEALTAAASAERDYAGLWLDQSINPAAGSPTPDDGSVPIGPDGSMNDQTKLIVNVAFTGDLERHRAELSKLWSGALCITRTSGKSEAELRSIQDSLPSMSPDFLSSEIDVTRGVILARFVVVPQYLQDGLDAKYGAGTVIAEPALQLVLVVD